MKLFRYQQQLKSEGYPTCAGSGGDPINVVAIDQYYFYRCPNDDLSEFWKAMCIVNRGERVDPNVAHCGCQYSTDALGFTPPNVQLVYQANQGKLQCVSVLARWITDPVIGPYQYGKSLPDNGGDCFGVLPLLRNPNSGNALVNKLIDAGIGGHVTVSLEEPQDLHISQRNIVTDCLNRRRTCNV